MKKTLSYSDRIKLEKTILGIIWIASGVLGFFDNIVSLLVQVVTSLVCIYTLLKVCFSKTEKADEMAEQNMNRAKALVHDYMLMAYCCLAIASILFLRKGDWSIDPSKILPNVVFISLGINQLLVGLAFRKYEAE